MILNTLRKSCTVDKAISTTATESKSEGDFPSRRSIEKNPAEQWARNPRSIGVVWSRLSA
jgi:hypothetical protein